MANNLRLDDYINLSSTGQQTETFIGQVEAAVTAVKKLQNIEVKFKSVGNTKDLQRLLNEINVANKQLEASTNKLIQTEKAEADITAKLARAKKDEASATEILSKSKVNEAKATTENAKAKKLEQDYTANLTKEKEKLERATANELKQQEKLMSAYQQLNARYKIAANTAKEFGITYGQNSQEFKEAAAAAQRYHTELLTLDRAVGQSQRNVGNYQNTQFALNQVMREAPSFAYGMMTGFSALSNNLPILRDEILKLKAANKELAASGQPTVSVFQTLTKALFSWDSAIVIGITLLTIYGKEIQELFTSMGKGKKNIAESALQLSKFSEEVENAKKVVERLTEQIEYLNDLGRINLDVDSTNVPRLEALKNTLIDINAQVILQREKVYELEQAENSMNETRRRNYDNLLKSLSDKDYKLFQSVGGNLKAAQQVMSEEGQKLVSAYAEIENSFTETSLKRVAESKKVDILYAQGRQARADIEKEAGEQSRKLILESSRIEADIIQARNDAILSNERSTLDQRLRALQNNLNARKRVIEAEKNDVLSNPESSPQEQSIAIKKANAQAYALKVEHEAEVFALKEEYRLRDLEAQKEAVQKQKEYEIALQEELSQNTAFALEERLRLQAEYAQQQRELLEDEYRLRLQQAGISDAEIRALAQNRDYRVKSKKITDEELRGLQVQHDTDLLQLALNTNEATTEILKSELQKQKGLREEHLADLQRLYDVTANSSGSQFARQLIALNEQFQQGKISYQKYAGQREAIEKDYQQRSSQDLIKHLQAQLGVFVGAEKKELDARGRVAQAKLLLEQATAAGISDAIRKELADKLKLAEEDLRIATEVVNKKIELQGKLSDATIKASDQSTEKAKKNNEETLSAIRQLAGELTGLAFDILTGGVDREKQRITEQISLIEQKKLKETEAANQSILNVEEREKRIKEIEVRAAAEKHRLEQQQRRLDLERARYERARAIAGIIQNTAMGVTAALASVPPNVPLSIIIGAIGAAQIARTLASPLPRFFKGKDKHNKYEGWGVVDDGGKPEVIERKDGSIEVGSNRERITYLHKDDVVHPDARKYLAQAAMRQTDKAFKADAAKVEVNNTFDIERLETALNKNASRVERAIKNKKELHLRGVSVGKAWISYNGSTDEYLSRHLNIDI